MDKKIFAGIFFYFGFNLGLAYSGLSSPKTFFYEVFVLKLFGLSIQFVVQLVKTASY